MSMLEPKDLLKYYARFLSGMFFQFKKYPDGRLTMPYSSDEIDNLLGVKPHEVKEEVAPLFNLIHPDDREYITSSILDSAATLSDWNSEFRIDHPQKGLRWLHVSATPTRQTDGCIIWEGLIIDDTVAKIKNQELVNSIRRLSVAAKINEMILYSETKDEIYKKACDIIISHGDFSLGWIGILNPDTNLLEPAVTTKQGSDYFDHLEPISVDASLQGQGPSGKAFREQRTVVCNDLLKDPDYLPWIEKAKEMGFRSSIALPLIINKSSVGTFNIYMSEVNFFKDSEIKVLEDITKNISFALEVVETKENLVKNELMFRTIFMESPVGIMLANSFTGEIFKVNDRYLEILGRARGAVIGTKWMRYMHPEDVHKDLSSLESLRLGQVQGFKSTERYVRPDNSVVWTKVQVVTYGSKGDPVPKCLVIAEDISERIELKENMEKILASNTAEMRSTLKEMQESNEDNLAIPEKIMNSLGSIDRLQQRFTTLLNDPFR